MENFRLRPDDLGTVGTGLQRPECVLCFESGDLVVSNGDGGVTRIRPDGSQSHILGDAQRRIAVNGIAVTARGEFLLADLALDGGGVWRLRRDGALAPFLLEVDGVTLPPTNFVGVDAKGRVWVTVSTRLAPRDRAFRGDVADGFIVLAEMDADGMAGAARVVAEGLGYTNEAIVDPSGDWLVVNETFARRTSRYRIAADGTLGARETVAEYGAGVFPDGLAFDVEGGIWLTSVVSNRLIRAAPDGAQTVVFEDCDAAALARIEDIFQRGELSREHLATVASARAGSISSIAFGGADRRTACLGNLLDDRIYTFRSPVAGAEPPHWRVRL